ncbi:MAG: general secretion pathway protein GspK [Sedimentisphaerales bacterium]|nr:general secretion pathway protein GspK [Sedimentisphaerales bacterium]
MILMITLVVLVLLATLGYTLTARVAARRHRDQYVIDYSQARYACASMLKYAMTSIGSLQPQLISRPNEPDFSDVFAMSEVDYQKFLAQFALEHAADANGSDGKSRTLEGEDDANSKKNSDLAAKTRRDAKNNVKRNARTRKTQEVEDARYGSDVNDVNDVNDVGIVEVPGPYGPPWPLATEAQECEIGSAKVKIEIEDENAKYPLNWALIADEQWQPLAETGFVVFCEWMGYAPTDIKDLKDDLEKIGQLRPYQLEFKPLAKTVEPPASLRSRVSRTPSTASRAAPARRTLTRTITSPAQQMEQQSEDFVKLFHSSMVNADLFRRPSIPSDTRNESAMKYLGLWAVRQVNVNTAPRHVLEAALTFGSAADAPKIAEEIIRVRQTKPFANIDEVKKAAFRYSDSIDKCKDFLTTASSIFTIRITAVSGVARVVVVAAVSKEGDKVKPLGVVSD